MEKEMTKTTTIQSAVKIKDLVHILTTEGKTLRLRTDGASRDALSLAQKPGTTLYMIIKETSMPSFYVQAQDRGMPIFLAGPEVSDRKHEQARTYQGAVNF